MFSARPSTAVSTLPAKPFHRGCFAHSLPTVFRRTFVCSVLSVREDRPFQGGYPEFTLCPLFCPPVPYICWIMLGHETVALVLIVYIYIYFFQLYMVQPKF